MIGSVLLLEIATSECLGEHGKTGLAFPKALWRFLRQIYCLGGEPSWIDFAFMKIGSPDIAGGGVVNVIYIL